MFINTRISLLLQIERIAGCYFTIVYEHILKGIGTFQDIHLNTFVFSSEFIDILVWLCWLRLHYFFCILFHTSHMFLICREGEAIVLTRLILLLFSAF